MSITPDRFNSFNETFDAIANMRTHSRNSEESSEQKLVITVGGKTYDITSETNIKYREGQGIRNWIRKKCGIKETAISITERRKAGSVAQDPVSGQTIRQGTSTPETIKCIFNKGKGLKNELRKLDEKLNLKPQSKPTAKQVTAELETRKPVGFNDELTKQLEKKRKSLSSSIPPTDIPQKVNDETIMNDLQKEIPELQDMEKLRHDKFGTLKLQIETLTTAINNKKTKSLNFQEIDENALLIISKKAELLRQANKRLNSLNQTTYPGASGTSHQASDIKRILENNIAFNENLFKVELARARNIANITIAHVTGVSPKDLQAMNDGQNNMQKLFEFELQAATGNEATKNLLQGPIDELREKVDQEAYATMCQEIEKQYQALMTAT
jgi:hypothetical protein